MDILSFINLKRLTKCIPFSYKLMIIDYIYSIPYYFFRFLPIKSNQIVLCNFYGKGFGDNPKYIALELLKHKNKFNLVWLVEKKDDSMPSEIKQIKINSLRSVIELVRARIWIDNSRKPYYIRKRNGQFYIQTWHGNIMLKKIEGDAEEKINLDYLWNAKNDSSIIDLFLSSSSFFTSKIRSSFWYTGQIIECGSPKIDVLLNNNKEKIVLIKNTLKINHDKKIAIYAPTFRNNNDLEFYNFNFNFLIEALMHKFGDDWIVFKRLHPSINSNSLNQEFNSKVINVSGYSDMQDLLLISDVLVTDYSSSMFEFALMKKPVFLFTKDISSFISERGVYFEFDELPFKYALDIQELVNNILSFSEKEYLISVDKFFIKINHFEKGNACVQVVNRINQLIN